MTAMKHNYAQKWTVSELSAIQKRGRVAKSPFLNLRLLRNSSFLSIVTFHTVNVKRVVL